MNEGHLIYFKRAAVAYLWAVTSASLSFAVFSQTDAIIQSGGFERATDNSFLVKTGHLLTITYFLFLTGWVFSFIASLIPFSVGIGIARYFNITHWAYFVTGAVITAVALTPVFIAIPTLGINAVEPESPFIIQLLSSLPGFIVGGSIAGAVFFYSLNTKFRSKLR